MSEMPSKQPVDIPSAPRKRRTRRRWFQFGLGTLLVLVTLCGVLLAAWRAYLAPYRAQRETMALIERLKGSYQTQEAPSWANRLSLTPAHNVVLVNLADGDQPAEYIDAVSRLPCLETLVVGGLAFGDEHLARLHKLSTLRWLVLDSTSVTDAGEDALRQALPHVFVHDSERRAIAVFRALKVDVLFRLLKVHVDTQFWGIPVELPQLGGIGITEFFEYASALYLMSSQVTDADLAHLGALKNLKSLHVYHTKVTDAGLAHVAGLKKLEWLNFHNANVTDAGLAHFSRLKNLERLDLDNTMVTDAGLAHLAGLENLKVLDLDNTKVTDAGLADLAALTNLTWLLLNNTNVTDAGLATLRQALPKCEIWPKP
jgi:hypothetical protein